MKKKLVNSSIFLLPWRWPGNHYLHLATIECQTANGISRKFIHFCDANYLYKQRPGSYNEVPAYIEEITNNADEPKKIQDDELWLELEDFLAEHKVHYCQRVNLPDELWRRHPQDRKHFIVPAGVQCHDILKMPVNITKKSEKS